ncbi:copper transporter [Rugosimonospora acidiphila]|uniref:Copper transporter n=1 Tax=Rugosimonospora acidiphila TaxID=556531 RepID=A0ABP9S8P9_9ACTN
MINFRYHVVSLTAVFLALAIGLVVGTAALNGTFVDTLKDQVTSLGKQNQQYRDQVSQLEAGAGKQETFATDSAPMLLQDRLAGRRVLVLSMPTTSAYVDDVVKMLGLAGAKVTGQIEVEDKFFDPASNEGLLDLADTTVPAGLTSNSTDSDGVKTASDLLASVLLDHNPALPADNMPDVVAKFKEANYIESTGQPTGPAEAVVVLGAQPYIDQQADVKNKSMLTMATQFDKAGVEAVATNGATGADNLVSELRADPNLQKTVSTVDNLATPQGQVALALAVDEQLTLNRAGHYGLGGGATSMLPKLVQGS